VHCAKQKSVGMPVCHHPLVKLQQVLHMKPAGRSNHRAMAYNTKAHVHCRYLYRVKSTRYPPCRQNKVDTESVQMLSSSTYSTAIGWCWL
jgi:hypothetical protein